MAHPVYPPPLQTARRQQSSLLAEPLLVAARGTGMPARFFDRTLFTRIVSRSRYELAFLAFFGFFNVYAMRVNLSVAVVTMKEQYGARHHVSRKIATPGHAFRITR